MVQPSNLTDVVQEFITHLALEAKQTFFLEQNDPGESFASPLILNANEGASANHDGNCMF